MLFEQLNMHAAGLLSLEMLQGTLQSYQSQRNHGGNADTSKAAHTEREKLSVCMFVCPFMCYMELSLN